MNKEVTSPVSTPVSAMAENLIGSEIIKLAAEVNAKIKNGEKIYNLTIGDFNPKIFPIPSELKEEILKAYRNDETNYPPADGIGELKNAVSSFIKAYQHVDYSTSEILIAGGSRPLIYATFRTLMDPEDSVLFPVPSWNNNHYCHLTAAQQVFIETRPENNFMPTAEELRPHIKKATLLALCSPLNPTGTTFTKEGLAEICRLVLEENNRRKEGEKPLYIMYDQVYSALTYGETKHYDPVSLYPELKNYTVFIDGISKSFAATGVRVGWAFGPKKIIDKMKAILGHVGAWAPRAEQLATAHYLKNKDFTDTFLASFKNQLQERLNGFYTVFMDLKKQGYAVDAITPQAAIYLTVKFDLKGKTTKSGQKLNNTKEVTKFLLDEAKIALVPFYAFGSSEDSSWYRLSVGTSTMQDVKGIAENLKTALQQLS